HHVPSALSLHDALPIWLGQAAYTAASIQTPQEAPPALRKVAFPRPFANLTDATASRYGVDQLLLESTLHAASHFDAWAENAASGDRKSTRLNSSHVSIS